MRRIWEKESEILKKGQCRLEADTDESIGGVGLRGALRLSMSGTGMLCTLPSFDLERHVV